MKSALLVAALALALLHATVARAENCVDKDEARLHGGRPCMDVGSSLGRVEAWRGPGFLDVRISALRLALYGNDAARRGTGFELGSWEALGDGDNLEAPRDQGDRSATHVLTFRRQRDTDGWGVYVGGDVLTRWYGHTRGLTPRFGLRLGRFDRAAIVVEGALAGAYLLGGDGDRRSLARDVDLTARATLSVARRLRVEARGRYRDLAAADGRRLRDEVLAIGVELEASPPSPGQPRDRPDTWRVLTLFAGLAVRRALVDVDPTDTSRVAEATRATTIGTGAGAAPPWQVLAWLDLDFAIDSQRTIW